MAADAEGLALRLVRKRGSSHAVELHLDYGLLAEILADTAGVLGEKKLPDEVRRRMLERAVEALRRAVEPGGDRGDGGAP